MARYNSFIGSKALFCCDRYRLYHSLDDLLRNNINLSNLTIANSRHNLTSDKMKEVALFLHETLSIRYVDLPSQRLLQEESISATG